MENPSTCSKEGQDRLISMKADFCFSVYKRRCVYLLYSKVACHQWRVRCHLAEELRKAISTKRKRNLKKGLRSIRTMLQYISLCFQWRQYLCTTLDWLIISVLLVLHHLGIIPSYSPNLTIICSLI